MVIEDLQISRHKRQGLRISYPICIHYILKTEHKKKDELNDFYLIV